jgi:hypothetical protein
MTIKENSLAMWVDGNDYYVVKVLPRSKNLIEERVPVKVLEPIKTVTSADFLTGEELVIPTSNLYSARASFIYIFPEELW